MNTMIKLVLLNLAILPLYLFFEFIYQNTFPFLMGVIGQLCLLLPLLALRKSGFQTGMLSAFVFSVLFITYNLTTHILNPSLTTFLIENLIGNCVSTGIASYRLDDKRAGLIFILVGIIIQIVMRFVA